MHASLRPSDIARQRSSRPEPGRLGPALESGFEAQLWADIPRSSSGTADTIAAVRGAPRQYQWGLPAAAAHSQASTSAGSLGRQAVGTAHGDGATEGSAASPSGRNQRPASAGRSGLGAAARQAGAHREAASPR